MTTIAPSSSARSVTEPRSLPFAPTASEPDCSPERAKTRRLSPSSSHSAMEARSKGTSVRICPHAMLKTSSKVRLELTAATMRLTTSSCSVASCR
jgi:hypothetical protein